jgi:hypothetical protein
MSFSKKNDALLIVALIFFIFISNPIILSIDNLTYYNQTLDFINYIFKDHSIVFKIQNTFFTIHNIPFVFLNKVLGFFFSTSIANHLIEYFISFTLTFYIILAFYICYLLTYKKIKNKLYSLFLCVVIFFGTGLITFFSGSYVENIIILLFFLRFYCNNRFILFLLDLSICLIKSYYVIFILFFCFLSEKKIFNKFLSNFNYFIFILLIVILDILIIKYFHIPNPIYDNVFNFKFKDILINLRDIFFSSSSGIFNTLIFLIIFIIFGSKKETIYKTVCVLVFFIFLSLFNFWYAHLPMSGRYILSIIPFFYAEILSGFKYFLKKKNFFKIIFLVFIFLNNLINLPTINIKNTSYKHYAISAVEHGIFDPINSQQQYFHPINSPTFHQYYFNYKFLKAYFSGNESFYFESMHIKVLDVYPSLGIFRVIYAINNADKIKNNKMLNEVNSIIDLLNPKMNFLLTTLIYILVLIYIFFNFYFLFEVIKITKMKKKNFKSYFTIRRTTNSMKKNVNLQ